MARYCKKPVVIDAFAVGIDTIPDWFMQSLSEGKAILTTTAPNDVHIEQRDEYQTSADILTLEGMMHANFGDYIIRGIKGEIYPCKPDIFEATYEIVKD